MSKLFFVILSHLTDRFISSMRRRYGIPDHDQRPFNIAYAAARLAQEGASTSRSGTAPLASPPMPEISTSEVRHIRHRANGTTQGFSRTSQLMSGTGLSETAESSQLPPNFSTYSTTAHNLKCVSGLETFSSLAIAPDSPWRRTGLGSWTHWT